VLVADGDRGFVWRDGCGLAGRNRSGVCMGEAGGQFWVICQLLVLVALIMYYSDWGG
jgi:hypothetical protein